MKKRGRTNGGSGLIDVWKTNNRATEFFFENLPEDLWDVKMPGAPRRTVRMVAGHIHNARCMWIKMIGRSYRLKPPRSVDRSRVKPRELLTALKKSSLGIIDLLAMSLDEGGALKMEVPWANIPSDAMHFMSYIASHEAHHRGQIVLAARASGDRLPQTLVNGLWQWKKRRREANRR